MGMNNITSGEQTISAPLPKAKLNALFADNLKTSSDLNILVKTLDKAENESKDKDQLAGAVQYASNDYSSINEFGETEEQEERRGKLFATFTFGLVGFATGGKLTKHPIGMIVGTIAGAIFGYKLSSSYSDKDQQ